MHLLKKLKHILINIIFHFLMQIKQPLSQFEFLFEWSSNYPMLYDYYTI